MQKPKLLSGQKAEITLVRSDKDDDYLKDIHCVVCGRILLQSYSSVSAIIPGLPERTEHNAQSFVLECKNRLYVYKNGQQLVTHCNTRYLIA